jgi:hypothetical protein
MTSITRSFEPLPSARLNHRHLAREWKTVTAMVNIYCREQHGSPLCGECRELMRYVSLRLDRCRFGSEKPTCAKCPVHCYQRDRREQIKTVMRFAGPRMLWEHPWLSLCHLWDGWFRKSATLVSNRRQIDSNTTPQR